MSNVTLSLLASDNRRPDQAPLGVLGTLRATERDERVSRSETWALLKATPQGLVALSATGIR
jgi:hypothetical protein